MENTFGLQIIPENEETRLEKLRTLGILDSRHQYNSFQHVAEMAVRMFNTPIALVNFVDSESVFTKGSEGLEVTQPVPRGVSLCSLAILSNDVTVFENALEQPCLLANPMVTGEFGLRFSAAAPLTTSDGHTIGAICIVDKEPREFPKSEQKVLEHLASIIMSDIEKEVA
jgi:GAF domain-containing protein